MIAEVHTLPVANRDEIANFLAQTVREHIHLVAIAPDGQPLPYGRYFGTDAAAAAAWAVAENQKGYGLYWTVNITKPGMGKKPEKADIRAGRFLHVDIDPPKDGSRFDRAQVLAALEALDFQPSFIIDSGGGFQAFWRLEYLAENLQAVEQLNRRLSQMFGGDHCHNIDRLMRLPGTVNYPNKKKLERGRIPTLSTVVESDTGTSVDPAEADGWLDPLTEREDVQREQVRLEGVSILSLGDLGIAPTHRLHGMAIAPKNPDRSSATYAFVCEMVRNRFTDEQIAGVLLNPNLLISGHCLDQSSPTRAASRVIGRARAEAAPAGNERPPSQAPGQDPGADGPAQGQRQSTWNGMGVSLDDFRAYMPMHNYIFMPSGEPWPASSVNSRIPPIPLVDKRGEPVLNKKDEQVMINANQWLDQHRPVEQMTWAPGEPNVIVDRLISDGGWIARRGCNCFNLYRPPVPIKGDAQLAAPWLDHIQRIYPDEARHIIKWLAHRVQRPEEKINHALVLGGCQGIGKDTLLEPVKLAIGPWNFAEVSPQHLLGRFNGFVRSVILRVSEARDLGDVDRFAFYDHMKTYTAAPPDVLRVDEKHLREYSVFNVCGVIITSNHKSDGIFLPADDRRHFVAWSDANKEDFSADYWSKLWRWYQEGGSGHVGAYLRELDLSDFNPKAPPPKTPAFWDIVSANRAPEDAELADALDKLGYLSATTLREIMLNATEGFSAWLGDRRNSRKVPHRLEECGYVPCRNPGAKDGLWKLGGARQVIYVKRELSVRDAIAAAEKLVSSSRGWSA